MAHLVESVNYLESLQNNVLAYLAGDNDTLCPQQEFKEIVTFGFSSMEAFIWGIPPSLVQCYQFSRKRSHPQAGMRFVVKSDPAKRGLLCKYTRVIQRNNEAANIITLRLDDLSPDMGYVTCRVTKLLFYIIDNFLPMTAFSWKAAFKHKLHPKKDYYHFELELEREYLKGCLNPTAFLDKHTTPTSEAVIAFSPTTTSNVQVPIDIYRQQIQFENINEKFPVSWDGRSDEGPNKGIEGAYNSCYMDVLLFTLFYTTKTFDFMANERKTDTEFAKVTRVLLKDKVIIPLRTGKYCSSDSIMELRTHLSEINEDIMGALMDVEELLYLLFQDVLNESEFIRYSGRGDDEDLSGDFMHLMSIDIEDLLTVITVQRNLETSFLLNENLKMERVPHPVLILGLPRSAGKLVKYQAVIPNVVISLDNVIEQVNCPCGKDAHWEVQRLHASSAAIKGRVFPVCGDCVLNQHLKYNRSSPNNMVKIVSRRKMKLFAIICIQGVHFVTFVRSNNSGATKWLFFDSMAGGYPEVTVVPGLERWLKLLAEKPGHQSSFGKVPGLVQRTLLDGHICIYEPLIYSPQ